MKDNGLHLAMLEKYTFKKDKPLLTSDAYTVYNGVQNETSLPVTIKVLRQFHSQLPKYLKKLKECKSQYVIKTYQTGTENGYLVFVTERVTYGNLDNALLKCKRLDDTDSIFFSKMLLHGHIDLLRSECNWFGNEEDIQITDGGIKLSWNNGTPYTTVNPFPKIIQKISIRPEDKEGEVNLLPFPKNKIILDFLKLCKENASEISVHPQLKKKDKIIRKKGKSWIALKETKNRNQYFEETTYLAVSSEHGFVRVKQYQTGNIDSSIVNFNKNKKTFTKVLETYDEQGKTYLVSEYSNDGNIQSYINRLKASSISLTEEHIQFFLYSMFQPLKQVQQSAVKSINTLHIKNIFIESGIPKIGEPVPMNTKIDEILKDRSEVPDFYHEGWKTNPKSRNESYDTYSLGVLLYKLMYTEYPIFPNGKVHIPTTPNYNRRLKTTLEIFLNEGGTIKQIEGRIQVSENVIKQVKENKEKLVVAKKKEEKMPKLSSKQLLIYEDVEEETERKESTNEDIDEEYYDEAGCCAVCCAKFSSKGEQLEDKSLSIKKLEESPYKVYRLCTKILFITCFYVFLFYFFYLQNDILLLANQNSLQNYTVKIATENYSIIITDTNSFETTFNTTNQTVSALAGLGCFMSGYNGNAQYDEFIHTTSSGWIGFITAGLLTFLLILVMKNWQIYKFDIVKAIYNYEHGRYNFNVSNFIVYNLFFASFLHGHFYFFNFIFYGHFQPCLGISSPYDSTHTLLNDNSKFNTVYVTTICLQYVGLLASALMISCSRGIKYNKIINPILLLGPFLIVQWLIIRIGVVEGYFAPNALYDSNSIILNYFLKGQYVGILGVVPELLVLGQMLIGFIIDWIYWGFIEKRRQLLLHDASAVSVDQ